MTAYNILFGKIVDLEKIRQYMEGHQHSRMEIVEDKEVEIIDKFNILSETKDRVEFTHKFTTIETLKLEIDEDADPDEKTELQYPKVNRFRGVIWNEKDYSVLLISKRKNHSNRTQKTLLQFFNDPRIYDVRPAVIRSEESIRDFLYRRYRTKVIYARNVTERLRTLTFGGDVLRFDGSVDMCEEYERFKNCTIGSMCYEELDFSQEVWFSLEGPSVTSRVTGYHDLEHYIGENIVRLLVPNPELR